MPPPRRLRGDSNQHDDLLGSRPRTLNIFGSAGRAALGSRCDEFHRQSPATNATPLTTVALDAGRSKRAATIPTQRKMSLAWRRQVTYGLYQDSGADSTMGKLSGKPITATGNRPSGLPQKPGPSTAVFRRRSRPGRGPAPYADNYCGSTCQLLRAGHSRPVGQAAP